MRIIDNTQARSGEKTAVFLASSEAEVEPLLCAAQFACTFSPMIGGGYRYIAAVAYEPSVPEFFDALRNEIKKRCRGRSGAFDIVYASPEIPGDDRIRGRAREANLENSPAAYRHKDAATLAASRRSVFPKTDFDIRLVSKDVKRYLDMRAYFLDPFHDDFSYEVSFADENARQRCAQGLAWELVCVLGTIGAFSALEPLDSMQYATSRTVLGVAPWAFFSRFAILGLHVARNVVPFMDENMESSTSGNRTKRKTGTTALLKARYKTADAFEELHSQTYKMCQDAMLNHHIDDCKSFLTADECNAKLTHGDAMRWCFSIAIPEDVKAMAVRELEDALDVGISDLRCALAYLACVRAGAESIGSIARRKGDDAYRAFQHKMTVERDGTLTFGEIQSALQDMESGYGTLDALSAFADGVALEDLFAFGNDSAFVNGRSRLSATFARFDEVLAGYQEAAR